MIIIDYNAIAIANIITQKLDVQEDMIRHMILNSIRMYNKKFRKEYGEMVIATDSSNWRRDAFHNINLNDAMDVKNQHLIGMKFFVSLI